MKNSRVSVVITAYNREQFLKNALQSVFSQSYKNLEVIVVDDCSQDETRKLMEHYIKRGVKYICHNVHQGASAARNTGIMHAKGEYVAFLDSDDEWFPQKLEKQVKILDSYDSDWGVVCTRTSSEGKRPITFIKHSGDIHQWILSSNFVLTTSTPLIRKSCFKTAGLFDETLLSSQDWDMWIRLGQHFKFAFIDEILVRYLHHAESITGDRSAKIRGMKIMSARYQDLVQALPRKLKSERYFYFAQNFWWQKSFRESFIFFFKSMVAHPAMFPKIFSFLMMRISPWKRRR